MSPAGFNDLMYTSSTDVNWGTVVVILFCVLGTGPGETCGFTAGRSVLGNGPTARIVQIREER